MTRSAQTRPITRATHGDDHHTPTDVWTSAGTRIPAAEIRARRVAREAGLWRAFAAERSRMRPGTLDRKSLAACAFSVHHGASSFAVPSKLVGTSRHQRALRRLSQDSAPWLALDLDVVEDGLLARHDGAPLGLVQSKHLGWVRPLAPFGLTVYLARVTGTGAASPAASGGGGYRLGCNVAFGHVGEALRQGADAAHGTSGDGAPTAPPVDGRSPLRLVVPGEARPIGVPVRPEYEALTGDRDDVVLWRTLEGEAQASVPHAARHSPTGVEWGYGGSGPADLARSVLLALADQQTAGALYQRFKAGVVATVPDEGGVLRAADIRAWVDAQAA